MFDELLLTVLLTSIPLILAATGELVVERSGVLNLGVEGMMLMGAVAAFGAASLSGSPYIGIMSGGMAGMFGSCLSLFVWPGHQSGGNRAGANHMWYRSFWPDGCAAGRTGNRRIACLAFAFYFKTAHFWGILPARHSRLERDFAGWATIVFLDAQPGRAYPALCWD